MAIFSQRRENAERNNNCIDNYCDNNCCTRANAKLYKKLCKRNGYKTELDRRICKKIRKRGGNRQGRISK